MHYYQFHIGDYRKDTVHLTPIEHYIYRSLIDWYYLDEKQIPQETQVVMRRLSLDFSLEKNLLCVLSDFFVETEKGWKHKRIEMEIADYHEMADKNRRNGKLGGRPTKTQSVTSGLPDETQNNPVVTLTINHKPETNNHKPITNINNSSVDGCVIELLNHLNEKTGRTYKPLDSNSKLIKARLKDGATVDEMKSVIDSKVKEWRNDKKMGKYLRPSTLFNAEKYAQYSGEINSKVSDKKINIQEWMESLESK